MAKKTTPSIKEKSSVGKAAATELASADVLSLSAEELRRIVGLLMASPSIDRFLSALRMAGKPLETAMLFRAITLLTKTLIDVGSTRIAPQSPRI